MIQRFSFCVSGHVMQLGQKIILDHTLFGPIPVQCSKACLVVQFNKGIFCSTWVSISHLWDFWREMFRKQNAFENIFGIEQLPVRFPGWFHSSSFNQQKTLTLFSGKDSPGPSDPFMMWIPAVDFYTTGETVLPTFTNVAGHNFNNNISIILYSPSGRGTVQKV